MPDQNTDTDRTRQLVFAMRHPDCYCHPVVSISILETHISWIILTGTYAYKIKKPVNFGFVDFSSLQKRKFYCEEELRLNRRFSTELYLQTVEIRGSHAAPSLGGDGEVIEYAVKMLEFPQQCLLSNIADKNQLLPSHIDSMAVEIAEIHRRIPGASIESGFGSGESIARWSEENFQQIERAADAGKLPDFFISLKAWHHQTFDNLRAYFDARRSNGFIRECHGDLHLANMVFLDNRCIAFDCIEFNDELRWIDTISEVAFVVMDLQARAHEQFSWHFLNHYLAITGDYSGLALLPYYAAYRALVRAKVTVLQVAGKAVDDNTYDRFINYLRQARRWSEQGQPLLIVMHGLSGSGKSTVAEDLAGRLGAIQIRSDIERKRLFGLRADQSSGSSVDQGIYTGDASERTYRRLKEMAEEILLNGFHVIVDATFLKSGQRDLFKQLAQRLELPRVLVSCQADERELQQRISRRLMQAGEASEASLEVLAQQLNHQQPLSDDELRDPYTIITHQPKLSEKQLSLIRAA